MPKDVLIITPFYPPNIGGAESFIEGLVKEASKWFKITILTYMPFQSTKKYSPSIEYLKSSSRILRMRWLISPSKAWKGMSLKNMFLVIPKMAICSFLLIVKEKYKIVHSQGLLCGLIGSIITRITGAKHYITLLALYDFKNQPKYIRRIALWIFRNTDLIFVEGLGGGRDLEGVFNQSKNFHEAMKLNNKVIMFNHWVDHDVFYPPKERPTDKIKVLFIGRPIPEKGRHIVEKAEYILSKVEPGRYEFTYVDNVEFSELPKIYRDHHILCVPSLYNEGFCRVVIEGASSGCAVITSDRGSLPEMVKDFGTVFNGTPEGLAIAIGNYYPKDGDRAYQYAKLNFSPTNALTFLNEY